MLAFLGAPQNIAFVSAIVLMLFIGLAQLIGIDHGADVDADFDGHPDLLSWLGVGRLPLLMLLVVFLACFGLIGLTGQQVMHDATGTLLSGWIAVPAALGLALPATGVMARLLARVMPQDFTTAVDVEDLVGEPARIVTGHAAIGCPARARVEDRFGQAHYVMVEPNGAGETFEEGEAVFLVRREGQIFRAISRGDHRLPHIGV